jgi:hypothetical protein
LRHPSARVQGHLPAVIERAARRIGARPPGGSFASLYGADPTMASIPIRRSAWTVSSRTAFIRSTVDGLGVFAVVAAGTAALFACRR